ncbi:DUF3011 domain-containing protein [Sphingomonas cannabina]|uniref:DUF3011 domain-containing protein n=1 Tax=Sphingomonas cannabina TaxID=2899123 RepID=UPI001F3570C2|nr:DUF3011 domain-containing protein [Sphingomonas cannabina]UIJ45366.1 DUF3011 domain-containing protein [Sphingomonas cannabina]
MRNKPVAALVIAALLSPAGTVPVAAQTRPVPLPSPVPDRPVPLPSPIVDRPVPLPSPVPGRPRPPRPPYPGNPGVRPPVYPGPGYGQTLRCESRRNRHQRCAANTENRVQLVRRLGGSCSYGRSWGYDRRSIWVDRGCRADFTYGRWAGGGGGGYYPPDRDKGPSTGAVIAGVAVAGGLIALLASSANKRKKEAAAAAAEPEAPATFPAGPPATLVADLSPLPPASRPSVQTCLREAARQIGATGGTRLTYDRLVSIEPGNGGWRFGASLTAAYPDGDRTLPFYCRATPTKVIQLDFANG